MPRRSRYKQRLQRLWVTDTGGYVVSCMLPNINIEERDRYSAITLLIILFRLYESEPPEVYATMIL